MITMISLVTTHHNGCFNASSQKQMRYFIRKFPQRRHFCKISLHKYQDYTCVPIQKYVEMIKEVYPELLQP